MKIVVPSVAFVFCILFVNPTLYATQYIVNSQAKFNNSISLASAGDTIIWETGYYKDIEMNINKSHLYIKAEKLGKTVFSGRSKAFISGSYVTLKGLQFKDGDIGSSDVLKTTGSYNHFTQLNISGYKSHKYLVVESSCRYNKVSYCNFENRINLDDKNILSILVDKVNPGYHVIQYCSFKNFNGTGGDLGIEPIRIGLSTQGQFISRTIVEYCYFTQCNGDGEIISNKARQNIFRYNTFQDNPVAELVLRHGDESLVYGNFFLNGMGGVRIKEGQNHYLYNNYFSNLSRRSIILQNNKADPLDSIVIAFNTIVNSAPVFLGGDGSYDPKNVTLANNIFSHPKDYHIGDLTKNEVWIGNLSNGKLGVSSTHGIKEMDLKLEQNEVGFYGLNEESPTIDVGVVGYPPFPNFDNIQNDNLINFDLLHQNRPLETENKDVGALEFLHNFEIKPLVNEGNTGPSYL